MNSTSRSGSYVVRNEITCAPKSVICALELDGCVRATVSSPVNPDLAATEASRADDTKAAVWSTSEWTMAFGREESEEVGRYGWICPSHACGEGGEVRTDKGRRSWTKRIERQAEQRVLTARWLSLLF